MRGLEPKIKEMGGVRSKGTAAFASVTDKSTKGRECDLQWGGIKKGVGAEGRMADGDPPMSYKRK